MKVVYTKHAIKKLKDLRELNIVVTKRLVSNLVKNPLRIDEVSDYPRKIIEGELDKNHILRVVCRKENDTIIVITFYPAKMGRYL